LMQPHAQTEMTKLVAKLVGEFIGTFLYVLTLLKMSGTVGLSYVAITYACAPASGAHFNPCITLVHYLRSDLTASNAGAYVGVQVFAALLAALSGLIVEHGTSPIPPSLTDLDATTWAIVITLEAIFAFALCLVHCNVLSGTTVGEGKDGNGYFGLAMGFTYFACYNAVVTITGGLFNPAVGLALYASEALVTGGLPPYAHLIPSLVGPIIGGLLAERAYFYQLKNVADASHSA